MKERNKMHAVCPNNAEHKLFTTVVHVTEFWKVDEHGDFVAVEDIAGEVVAGPDKDNIWTCCECCAEADVTDAEEQCT